MLGLRLPFLSVLLLFCVVFSSCFFMINALVVGLAACHPDQIKSLMQFKNEFESTSCNQSDYFNAVMCDNSTGAVTKLNLPSGCLSGILKPNSSLFGLHHLRYLNLSYNDFTSSSISARFGNLNRLEVLSLSSNGFIGQVPSSFSNLSRLDLLDLSLNHLTGSFPLLRNLTNLSILDLSYNHFTGTLSPSSSLFELYYLRYLDLSYNNFISSPLSSHFSNLNRLEVFSLAYNHFSGIIPSSLFMMPFLSSIYLDGNKFTGPIEVPNSSLSSRLETLSLGYNQFEGQILEPISNLITLKVLDLQSCQISHFPNFLKNLQKLEHIELSNNKLKGKIPKWLWTLPRLTIVSLVNNSFTDLEGSEEVLVNSPVRILDLALNHFKGPFPKPPLSINVLSIWNNSFTGNIPLETCNRTSLTILDLSYNNFTGPIPSCLSNITIVNLRRNNFEGSLPDMFHDGALLRTLDVGYNQLTGKLPRSLLNCSLLKFLSLDHNRLRDTFPFWIKALPDLQALTLRSNKFYGPMSLPGEGPLAFPKLRILEISDNNFTGSLPSNYFVNWEASSPQMDENGRIYMGVYSIPSYTYEDTIDLQYKGLFMEQGKILTSYATIDFSRNKLEGQIPESIGHLKSLIALNLSNNAFTGHIPPSLENVTELESLDLSRNQLSGTIPNGLKTLSFLAYISVAHNQLKGEIPQGTQITGQSKSSFEGNAGLCGLPLEETCFGSKVPATQPPEEDDEHVLNWKAVAIAYGPGMLLGLAIGQVIATYKSEWILKIFGRYKRRNC